jgi:uncharacterized protein (DUF4415 family)
MNAKAKRGVAKNDRRTAEGRTDWARIDALTAEDIERMAAEDAENPATSAADWVHAVVTGTPEKTVVNAKFDRDVVDWFKSQGRGYQARMNAVLRTYMQAGRRSG